MIITLLLDWKTTLLLLFRKPFARRICRDRLILLLSRKPFARRVWCCSRKPFAKRVFLVLLAWLILEWQRSHQFTRFRAWRWRHELVLGMYWLTAIAAAATIE